MPFQQRDLVNLKYEVEMPDGTFLYHPVLIISSNLSNGYEDFYTGVMMSSTAHKDRFSFFVKDFMFENPLKKDNCQFRTYLILSFRDEQVKGKINTMIKPHFSGLLNNIKDYVICMS